MRALLGISAVATITIATAVSGVRAADYPEVLFILDASGSMTEDAGGVVKIDAAKQSLTEVVHGLSQDVNMGLVVYGHRRKGDCSDIEVVIPPGSRDREALLHHVQALEPKGKTPISDAILTASGLIKSKEVETTIVLVSDGIETCGGDPCQVVAQLKATGCNFVLHVVGFDVGAAAAEQLECIAGAGAGRYFGVEDRNSLLEALQTVTAEVEQKVQQVKLTSKSATGGLGKLRITMPEGAEKSLAYIHVGAAGQEKLVKEIKKPAADSRHPLAAGKYEVVLGFASPSMGRAMHSRLGDVSVRRGEDRVIELGSVAFNMPEEMTKDDSPQRLHVDHVILADPGTNEPVVVVRANMGNDYYHYVDKPVLPGIYNLVFDYHDNTDVPVVVAKGVQVLPGKKTTVTIDAGIQFRKVDAGIVGWDLIPKSPITEDASEDAESEVQPAPAISVRATHATGGGDRAVWYPYAVPPGRYDVLVHVKGMSEPLTVTENLEIKSGDMIRFDSGF